MHSISYYQEKMSNHFSQIVANKEPKNLYEPIEYILSLGGKRMRPVLTLMASEVFRYNFVYRFINFFVNQFNTFFNQYIFIAEIFVNRFF